MFVRHGEKPGAGAGAAAGPASAGGKTADEHGVNQYGEHDSHSLSVRGWTRAGALAPLFAHAPHDSHAGIVKPARVFATKPSHETKSRRELDTATPTAERLGLPVDAELTRGDEPALAQKILGSPDDTLVVWHHGELPHLLAQFPVENASDVPHEWPSDRFDLIWLLQRRAGGELSYRFSITPQMLLVGDKPTT